MRNKSILTLAVLGGLFVTSETMAGLAPDYCPAAVKCTSTNVRDCVMSDANGNPITDARFTIRTSPDFKNPQAIRFNTGKYEVNGNKIECLYSNGTPNYIRVLATGKSFATGSSNWSPNGSTPPLTYLCGGSTARGAAACPIQIY
ncbi:hypothetical protein BH10PSE19_BH10PSE19_06610 [soil metagenome]